MQSERFPPLAMILPHLATRISTSACVGLSAAKIKYDLLTG
jgi:hypothetical protein